MTEAPSPAADRDGHRPPSARPLRILHVVESWPPVISGYTTRSARLVEAQQDHPDLEPTVFVSSRQHMYLDRGSAPAEPLTGALPGTPVTVSAQSGLERAVRTVRAFTIDAPALARSLRTEIAERRPDVVHVHWSSSIGRQAVRVARQCGVPVVAEVRFDLAGAMNAQTFGGRLDIVEPPLRRHFERHLADADAVVAASFSLGQLVESHSGVRPTIVLNAVDEVEPVDPARVRMLRDSVGVDADTMLIGCVTKVLAYEGLDRMVRIAARLRRDGLNVRPVIVGDGPELAAVRGLADELDVDLISPGNVAPTDVGCWYGAIDVVVVPRKDVSVTQYAAPLKVMEALAFGRPIVASDVGDIGLLLDEGRGVTVDASDEAALAAAIAALVDDADARKRLGGTGRRWASSRPGWDATADQLLSLYRQVIADTGSEYRPMVDPVAEGGDRVEDSGPALSATGVAGGDLSEATSRFAVVVPTFDRPDQLATALKSLADVDSPVGGWELIVVDDGTPDGVQHVVDRWDRPDVEVTLLTQANAGPAAARNRGGLAARSEYLAFTDDDCLPRSDWLLALEACLEARPDALVGGPTVPADHDLWLTASELIIDFVRRRGDGPMLLPSNNLACRTEAFRRSGGFDVTFPDAAGEDREFSHRWAQQIGPLHPCSGAVVAHGRALGPRSFWRQQVGYGRGAVRYRHRASSAEKPVGIRFVASMIAHPLRTGSLDAGAGRRLGLAACMALSQLGVAFGAVDEHLRGSRTADRAATTTGSPT